MDADDREINFFDQFPDSEPSNSDERAAAAAKLNESGASVWRRLGLDRLFGNPVGTSAKQVKGSTAFWKCAGRGMYSAWLAGMAALLGLIIVSVAVEGSAAFESIPLFLTLGALFASVISVVLGFAFGGAFGAFKAWGSAPKVMAFVGSFAWLFLFSHLSSATEVWFWFSLASCLLIGVGAGWHFRRACLRDSVLNPEALAT